MPGQIQKDEQESRAHRAADVAQRLECEYLESLVGSVLPVLFEEEKNGLWRGHAPNYVPVLCEGENLHNVLKSVRISGVNEDSLTGVLV